MASLISNGTSLPLTDNFSGAFGEFVGSVDIFGIDNGLSGFFNGAVKFNQNFTSETITAGIRYHW
jgi:basic membrane lipoprotein Med (substrate-binding protein (PBP1-ABC) superfamily)